MLRPIAPALKALLWCLPLLLLAACAGNRHVDPPPELTPRALSESDRRFVLEAAASGLVRIEAARLAEQRATDPMLKAYAAMLVQQTGAANDELRALVQSRGIVWLGAAPAARRGVLQDLTGLAGDAFDRRFAEQVGVADHQADLLLFEAAGRSIEDPSLRAWVARMVPLLQQQLATAQQLPLLQRPVARVRGFRSSRAAASGRRRRRRRPAACGSR